MMVQRHTELQLYQKGIELAMEIYAFSKLFPREETYSLTDQIRPSSRSVCANTAEAWRRRRYEAAFVNKLNEVEAEAAETQTWLDLARRCDYISNEDADRLASGYDEVLRLATAMINNSGRWCLERKRS
jgi:four helix bundle protein